MNDVDDHAAQRRRQEEHDQKMADEYRSTGERIAEAEDQQCLTIFTALTAGTVFLMLEESYDIALAMQATGGLFFLVGVVATLAHMNISRRQNEVAVSAYERKPIHIDYLMGAGSPTEFAERLSGQGQAVYNAQICALIIGTALVAGSLAEKLLRNSAEPFVYVSGASIVVSLGLFFVVRWILDTLPHSRSPR